MATYCRKCGKKKEDCTCKKSKLNSPMITTIVITTLIVAGLIYFIASLLIAKPKEKVSAASPNNKNEEVEENNNEEEKTTTKEETNTKEKSDINIVTCSGNDGRTNNQNIFYFENGSIYKYVVKIEIPVGYDAKEFYNSEEIMNSGRYKMSLSGRTIIQELDPSMPYWDDFIYKDEPYRRIYKIFTEYGYNCEG
ncbi:MAG: hypothetical protein E7162_05665 [Firmicutes bacterium]|nr:hypothetical protein [Bacillota bacterium]